MHRDMYTIAEQREILFLIKPLSYLDVKEVERSFIMKEKNFVVKMMTDRKEGYKIRGYFETAEEAKELVRALIVYYEPIDIYYTYA